MSNRRQNWKRKLTVEELLYYLENDDSSDLEFLSDDDNFDETSGEMIDNKNEEEFCDAESKLPNEELEESVNEKD